MVTSVWEAHVFYMHQFKGQAVGLNQFACIKRSDGCKHLTDAASDDADI